MCIHASWMPAASCSRCNKPIPTLTPRGRRGRSNAKATDRLLLDADLRTRVLTGSSNPIRLSELMDQEALPDYTRLYQDECIFFTIAPGTTWERGMPVKLKSGEMTLTAAPRVVYAFSKAFPAGLRDGQNVLHWCAETFEADGTRLCCVNPIHLVADA